MTHMERGKSLPSSLQSLHQFSTIVGPIEMCHNDKVDYCELKSTEYNPHAHNITQCDASVMWALGI